MIVAPSEPPDLKALASRVSNAPETYGCDIFWHCRRGKFGVQRKVFPGDFLASVYDGRFTTIRQKMQRLDFAILILEGRATWTSEGELDYGYGRPMTRGAFRKFLWSLRAEGMFVDWSDSLADTIDLVKGLHEWSRKGKHRSLYQRAGVGRADEWGGAMMDREGWQAFVLQGVPGIGPEVAQRIIEGVGCPIGLTVSEEDLLGVHGVGKGTVGKLVEVLGGGSGGRSATP